MTNCSKQNLVENMSLVVLFQWGPFIYLSIYCSSIRYNQFKRNQEQISVIIFVSHLIQNKLFYSYKKRKKSFPYPFFYILIFFFFS